MFYFTLLRTSSFSILIVITEAINHDRASSKFYDKFFRVDSKEHYNALLYNLKFPTDI